MLFNALSRLALTNILPLHQIRQHRFCHGKNPTQLKNHALLNPLKNLYTAIFYAIKALYLHLPLLMVTTILAFTPIAPAQALSIRPISSHFSIKELVYKLFPFIKPDDIIAPPIATTPTNAGTLSPISTKNTLATPSLALIMQAEFMADRGDMPQALQIYKQQAFKKNATAVFERGLGLSIANEDIDEALQFAQTWQQHHPEHIPALFYVTHLALKSHDYELAGKSLGEILAYDPDADLSQILIGIYPTDSESQTELLTTLQQLNTRDNPSLLVMKAGLLLQFDQPKLALNEINKALKKQPTTPAFMILKADILQKLATTETVARYIRQARHIVPDNKNVFLYQVRFLINQGDNEQAWQLLNTNPEFLSDDEIKLLAALVGLDIERYREADQFLQDLSHEPSYQSQANYYLGISAERQLHLVQAIDYYSQVNEPEFILNAKIKQIALLVTENRYDEAINTAIQFRENFEEFAPQSYILQANVLQKMGKTQSAIDLLSTADKQIPNTPSLLYAQALLLPETETKTKRNILLHLLQIDPKNVEYQLAYAQFLVSQKTDFTTVEKLLLPLLNDKTVGLKARQLMAQQALHQQNYAQIIDLLADSFDIKPDVISGLLLRQAYLAQSDGTHAEKINKILINQLHYSDKN